MVEHASEHSYAHPIAKLDHTGGKAFTRLGEVLHETSGCLIFACDQVDRKLVAKIPQMEGSIETAINTRGVYFFRRPLRQRLRAVSPAECQARHRVNEALWITAYIRLTNPGLIPTNSRTRKPLSSRPSISLRNIGQLMSPSPAEWTGVNM